MLFVWRQAGFKYMIPTDSSITKFIINNVYLRKNTQSSYKGLKPYDIHEWMVER